MHPKDAFSEPSLLISWQPVLLEQTIAPDISKHTGLWCGRERSVWLRDRWDPTVVLSASPDPCWCCHKAHDGSRRWLLLLQKYFRCFRKHYFCLLHSKQADVLTTSVLVTIQGHEDVSEQARVAAGSSCALTSGCPSCPRWTILASELPWVPLSSIAFCWERLSGAAYGKYAEQNSSLVFIAKAG